MQTYAQPLDGNCDLAMTFDVTANMYLERTICQLVNGVLGTDLSVGAADFSRRRRDGSIPLSSTTPGPQSLLQELSGLVALGQQIRH